MRASCHYLGRVGRVDIGGVVIVGLTGIYSAEHHGERPSPRAFDRSDKKRYTYFSQADVETALAFGSADVLMLHEWPRGAITEAQIDSVRGRRKASDPGTVGSEPAR